MKHPCATFSDSRHAVQTTKIGVPTQNTTENWTTKSWHFIYFRLHMYRLQWILHVRPSRIRDILFKLLKLVFLVKALLKAGPPNLGILYRLHIYRIQWKPPSVHVRPSRIHDMLFEVLNLVFPLEVLLTTGPPNLGILYRLNIYKLQWNLHVRLSRIRDMLF